MNNEKANIKVETKLLFECNTDLNEQVCYTSDPVGETWESLSETDRYMFPMGVSVYGCEADEEDMYLDYEKEDMEKIGYIQCMFVWSEECCNDGLSIGVVCDDYSADYSYMIYKLMKETLNGKNQHNNFDSNVLYIEDMNFADGVEEALKDRIIRELPALCRQNLHIRPEIITYIASEKIEKSIQKSEIKMFERNGFKKIRGTGIVYAYCIN